MQIIERNIADLIRAEYNPRELTQDQEKQLSDSLRRFGVVDPVIVNVHPDRKDIIIGGHQRSKVWQKLGNETIPTVELSLTYDQEKELNVRLNKNTGQFDMDMLKDHFETDDLIEWGFTDVELDWQEDVTHLEAEEDDFEVPEEVETDIVQGDLIEIGPHRLLCGDSTNSDDVERLMDGHKADMVFTDPPYNIDYQGVKDKRDKIKNDKMPDEDFIQFLYDALNINSDTFYVCCSWQYSHLFREALEKLQKPVKSFIIWNKVNPAQHLDKYFKQHEVILYHGKFGGQKTLRGDIWEVKRERNTVHPTMKPIKLIEMALNDNNDKSLIYDAFLGSGSTMVASHQLNRKCYGMELDPKYCQVIVDRMMKLDPSLSVKINGKDYGQE